MSSYAYITDAQMIRQYKLRTSTLTDGSKFIPLEKGLVDIFTGVEWLQQSRYRYAKERWLYISGHRLVNSWIAQYLPTPRNSRVH